MTTRAAILARVSVARGASVPEQVEAGRKAAAGLGWTVTVAYVDEGISASRFANGKARPGWQSLRREIAAGSVQAVILWEPSRGSRDLPDWSAFLAECREHGALIHVITHDRTYSMRTARDWRIMAEDGVSSAYESEQTSERAVRSAASRKALGRPMGRPPAGYRRVHDMATGKLLRQEPDERAPAVARFFDDLASGVSMSEACRTLGVTRQAGQVIARQRAYIGERRGPDGGWVEGGWPAIVPEDVWHRVQEIMDGHRGAGRHPSAYRSLLGHLAVCGVCGGPTTTHTARDRYRCVKGCVVADISKTDLAVEFKIADLLSREGVMERFMPSDDAGVSQARAEAAALRERLDEARAGYAAGRIGFEALERVERDLKPALDAAEDRAAKLTVPAALYPFAGMDRWQDIWLIIQDMPLNGLREAIRALAEVQIHKRGELVFVLRE